MKGQTLIGILLLAGLVTVFGQATPDVYKATLEWGCNPATTKCADVMLVLKKHVLDSWYSLGQLQSDGTPASQCPPQIKTGIYSHKCVIQSPKAQRSSSGNLLCGTTELSMSFRDENGDHAHLSGQVSGEMIVVGSRGFSIPTEINSQQENYDQFLQLNFTDYLDASEDDVLNRAQFHLITNYYYTKNESCWHLTDSDTDAGNSVQFSLLLGISCWVMASLMLFSH